MVVGCRSQLFATSLISSICRIFAFMRWRRFIQCFNCRRLVQLPMFRCVARHRVCFVVRRKSKRFASAELPARPHEVSSCGRFSWEEVECLGSCANAPMVQIGKDTYEDLTPDLFEAVLDGFGEGRIPKPGSQIGRQASCPKSGPTTLISGTQRIHSIEESGET